DKFELFFFRKQFIELFINKVIFKSSSDEISCPFLIFLRHIFFSNIVPFFGVYLFKIFEIIFFVQQFNGFTDVVFRDFSQFEFLLNPDFSPVFYSMLASCKSYSKTFFIQKIMSNQMNNDIITGLLLHTE